LAWASVLGMHNVKVLPREGEHQTNTPGTMRKQWSQRACKLKHS
jgi:hypothetical protein